eukprot:7334580-Alexandrium_andersonii.AAC.1
MPRVVGGRGTCAEICSSAIRAASELPGLQPSGRTTRSSRFFSELPRPAALREAEQSGRSGNLGRDLRPREQQEGAESAPPDRPKRFYAAETVAESCRTQLSAAVEAALCSCVRL